MAGLAVGGWFASAAIDKLADKARDYLQDQYEYQAGAKDDLKKLQHNLPRIQAVIHEAEKGQIQDPSLKTWLRDLRDAAFDAEDLLDKFDYQLLEAKVEKQNKVRDNCASSSSCHNILKHAETLVKRLIFSDDDLNKLREIVRSFDGILAQTRDFLRLVDINASGKRRQETLDWRKTTSTPDEPEIVGREIVINEIVNSLVRITDDSGSNNNEIFSVLSIVGIGGVGKTTVAQHVFDKIKEHFDLKIWVCVSETFDVRRLTIEMIESASESMPMNLHQFSNLDKIQGILKEKLKDKRFLIVLDDVWNIVGSKWGTLRKPFKFGKERSRIMVTTRYHTVAAAVGTKKTVDLEGLAEEDFWTFFRQCAFGDKILEHHPKLELIGREIAKKLGGLPLAAKTVGSILNPKLEEEHWRGILKSKLWELEQQEDGIMPALKLSYDYLPAQLKQCFAYCSLFPKDYLFDKEKLVQLWMAQGFVPHHEERKRAEDVGVQYFDYLLQRCFFQKADGRREDRFGRREDRYKIHDLLHDLAEYVIDDECCRITNAPVQIPKRPRHLHIAATNHRLEKCENVCDICDIKKLRSLVVAGEFSLSDSSGLARLIQYILKESKQLRVLILSDIPFHLSLEAIGDLIHLRYIETVFCNMLKLPMSSCKLYHLQVLNVPLIREMNPNLPIDVNNCINLRHVNGGWIDTPQVDGIGKLTCLQEIEHYFVNDKCGGIGQLRNSRQLRGMLQISHLENVRNKEEAREAMLHDKEHLEFLDLTWSRDVQDHRADVCKEIIEELRPHTNLTGLHIGGYSGITSPSWLSKTWLSNLESIRLEYCHAWAVLPPLGHLPFLKFLYFNHMHSVKEVGAEFYGSDGDDTAFPSLEELRFGNLDEWEEWLGPKKDRLLFPRLRKLHIYGCPKLRRTLVLPNPSQEFNFYVGGLQIIWIHDDVASPSKLQIYIDHDSQQFIWGLSEEVLASIKYLQFNCYRDFRSFSFIEKIVECFQKLTSLKVLRFYYCYMLGLFPVRMMSLTSLERLEIIECSDFESLLEGGLPTSLKELYISPCTKELEEWCQISNWPLSGMFTESTLFEAVLSYIICFKIYNNINRLG